MKRFILYPGDVISQSDGQRHHIGFLQLCRCYGLNPDECVNRDSLGAGERLPGLQPLFPLGQGNYEAHLLRVKRDAFTDYVRTAKLLAFNQGDKKRAWAAERNQLKLDQIARTWPDFPAIYAKGKG